MPAEILLVRHGQTESNRTGYFMGWSAEDLNATGRDQVERLAFRLASLEIRRAYASPLKRAEHTAEIIAAPHKPALEAEKAPDLIEINQGELQGVHRSETEKRYPQLWVQLRTDPSAAAFPGGESFSQTAARTLAAFESIIAQNPEGRVLLVAHEINLKIIIIHILGAPFSIYRRFDIANASLSIARSGDQGFRMISVNDTSHLA